MPVRSTPTPQLQVQEVDLSSLNRDVEVLIAAARTEFANNPLDPSVQQRLKALLDLQGIMQRQQLTQGQLKLVRDQVSALAPKPSIPAAQPAPSRIPVTSAPTIATPPVAQSFSQPLQQLLNPGTLAELIKATAARQQPTPPQVPSVPQLPVSSTPQIPSSAPENPLIAALRAKGLLPASSAPPGGSVPSPTAGAFPFIVPGQVRYTPPVPTPQAVSTAEVQVNVQMNTASIKM